MQVSEHVHAIKIPFEIPLGPGETVPRFVYAYLICGEKICLIDSGVASSKEIIFDYIATLGRSPREITMMILTHSHPDHIGSAQAIKESTNCVVAAHSQEQAWIEDVALQLRQRPVPGFQMLVGGSVQLDRLLEDGDVIDLDTGLKLDVFHTPGHSAGSLSLLLHEDRVLFTGDLIPKPGAIPIYEDVLACMRSIVKLRGLSALNVLLSSWDEPRQGRAAYRVMDDGVGYIKTVHDAVVKIADADRAPSEPMELCRLVVRELGLPQVAVNPIVLRTFLSHLNVHKSEDLLSGI